MCDVVGGRTPEPMFSRRKTSVKFCFALASETTASHTIFLRWIVETIGLSFREDMEEWASSHQGADRLRVGTMVGVVVVVVVVAVEVEVVAALLHSPQVRLILDQGVVRLLLVAVLKVREFWRGWSWSRCPTYGSG